MAQTATPNFANTILALEELSEELEAAQTIFHNLTGTEADEDYHKIAQELAPIESKFGTDLMLDARIFARVKAVYDNRANENLNAEQLMLLDKTYKAYVRNGVALPESKKKSSAKSTKRLRFWGRNMQRTH